MAGALRALFVTPRQLIADTTASQVIAPAVDGQVTILPGHAPLLSDMGPGVVRVQGEQVESVYFVTSGFIEVSHDRVAVLAQGAQRLEDIDAARAQVDHAELTARLRMTPVTAPGWSELKSRVNEARARVEASQNALK